MFAAIFVTALVAIHFDQVLASRTARMYALGAFFTAFTSWAMLRALRERDEPLRWWVMYSCATAGFWYTHNFSFFTTVAQASFVVALAVSEATCGIRLVGVIHKRTVQKLFLAGLTAILLYSPWLPTFLGQANRVHQQFWIPSLTWSSFFTVLGRWLTGIEAVTHVETWLCLAVALSILLVACKSRSIGATFFLVQAGMPWLLVAVVSTWGERPLLQERYLTFAQVSLLSLVGLTTATLSRPVERLALSSLVISIVAFPTCRYFLRLPTAECSWKEGLVYMMRHYEDNDVIIVSSPGSVNIWKYYGHYAGIRDVDVRCFQEHYMKSTGHINHISSLSSGDFLREERAIPSHIRRVWFVDQRRPLPSLSGEDWVQVSVKNVNTVSIEGKVEPYRLLLFERRAI